MVRVRFAHFFLFTLFTEAFLAAFSTNSPYFYIDSAQTQIVITPNGTSIFYEYDESGNLKSVRSDDETIDYTLEYDRKGGMFITDQINQQTISRWIDEHNCTLKEMFPNGQQIQVFYDHLLLKHFVISSYAEVHYEYTQNGLSRIKRLSPQGELLYEHSYRIDEENGIVQEELIGNIGQLYQQYDPNKRIAELHGPFERQIYQYDEEGNIVHRDLGQLSNDFHYDVENQLLLGAPSNFEKDIITQWGTRIIREIECEYDANGNVIYKCTPTGEYYFTYDAFDRLIEASIDECEVRFTYDLFGRRLSKTVLEEGKICYAESYLYLEDNEIAIYNSKGELTHFRIPGGSFHESVVKAIAIECPSGVYAPIHDHSCNFYQLVDINTGEIISFETLHPFGDNMKDLDQRTPWVYSAKQYDPELNLFYFGQRYYDPMLRRWLTWDPLGSEDNPDPYIYCLNNPLKYVDPDGRFVVVVPVIIITGGAVKFLAGTAAAAAAAWGGHKAGKAYKKWKDQHERMPPQLQEQQHSSDQGNNNNKDKKGAPYWDYQIQKGRMPKSMKRIHEGGRHEKPHVHFRDGRILKSDGTWRGKGSRKLTREELEAVKEIWPNSPWINK